MDDKFCFRCLHGIQPGAISFLPGMGWACPPSQDAECAARQKGLIDISGYGFRIATLGHDSASLEEEDG